MILLKNGNSYSIAGVVRHISFLYLKMENIAAKRSSHTHLCCLKPIHDNNGKDQSKCVSQKSTLKILALFSPGHIETQCQCYKNT